MSCSIEKAAWSGPKSFDEKTTETPLTYFRLPDLLPEPLLRGTSIKWPCDSPVHSLQETIKGESLAWVKDLDVMSEKRLAKFAKYEIMILVAWAYRRAKPAHFRLCADFMNLYWIIDDIVDQMGAEEAQNEVISMKRILADPNVVLEEPTHLERTLQSWWKHVLDALSPPPATKRRFLRDFTSYLESLPEEALDRETGRLRNLAEHFDLRRRTGGLLPSFDFICMPFELPDHIADHEIVKRMTIATGDLVIIANDVYSYNVEQAGGQKRVAHNIVDVVLRDRRRGVQDAMDVVGTYYRDLFLLLIRDYNSLPSFDEGEHDEVLKEYALGLLDWVEANVEFSLGSQRYFGARAGAKDLRESRWVELLPVES